MVTEAILTKYYGGLVNSVFSPEQMEKQVEDDEGYEDAAVRCRVHDLNHVFCCLNLIILLRDASFDFPLLIVLEGHARYEIFRLSVYSIHL